MIKFFVLIALIFGGVYYSLSREDIPEIAEEDTSPHKKINTVVAMANYLSEKEKKDAQLPVQPKIDKEDKNVDVAEETVAAYNDPESTVPLEYTQPEDLAARMPSGGEEDYEEKEE